MAKLDKKEKQDFKKADEKSDKKIVKDVLKKDAKKKPVAKKKK